METCISPERPRLVVTEKDLSASVRTALKADSDGTRVLGEGDDASRTFWDGVTAAILRRASSVAPEGFQVVELEITLDVEGKLFGTGIGGQVSVRLAPKGP